MNLRYPGAYLGTLMMFHMDKKSKSTADLRETLKNRKREEGANGYGKREARETTPG